MEFLSDHQFCNNEFISLKCCEEYHHYLNIFSELFYIGTKLIFEKEAVPFFHVDCGKIKYPLLPCTVLNVVV
jgi:hypothetical protein